MIIQTSNVYALGKQMNKLYLKLGLSSVPSPFPIEKIRALFSLGELARTEFLKYYFMAVLSIFQICYHDVKEFRNLYFFTNRALEQKIVGKIISFTKG